MPGPTTTNGRTTAWSGGGVLDQQRRGDRRRHDEHENRGADPIAVEVARRVARQRHGAAWIKGVGVSIDVVAARTPTSTNTAVGQSLRTKSGATTRSCAVTSLPRSGSAVTTPITSSARTGATSHRIDGQRGSRAVPVVIGPL